MSEITSCNQNSQAKSVKSGGKLTLSPNPNPISAPHKPTKGGATSGFLSVAGSGCELKIASNSSSDGHFFIAKKPRLIAAALASGFSIPVRCRRVGGLFDPSFLFSLMRSKEEKKEEKGNSADVKRASLRRKCHPECRIFTTMPSRANGADEPDLLGLIWDTGEGISEILPADQWGMIWIRTGHEEKGLLSYELHVRKLALLYQALGKKITKKTSQSLPRQPTQDPLSAARTGIPFQRQLSRFCCAQEYHTELPVSEQTASESDALYLVFSAFMIVSFR